MVDWSGHAGQPTNRRYRSMAERQLRGISPSYERLCLGVADDGEVLARLDTLPPPKRQPNLLLGAVRFLGGPVDSYTAFRAFLLDRWDALSATMLDRRTQTNEPRRCTVLLLVLAALPQPLALLEVGAAAGLCLYPDRYAYRYAGGPVLGDAALVFDCAVAGPAPLPTALPSVAWRAGLDLNPLDVADDEDVRWLESLIWPEQTERFAILRKAVQIARADPAPVRTGDLTRDLVAAAASVPADAMLVVFHSAVVSYLDETERARFRSEVAELAAARPMVWVSNEGPGVIVDLPTPPGPVPFVLARDETPLAYADPHGASVDWFR
ncbi:MAG TPA: DUF2332 domain-containing protein [Jatrophihabitans sp.]|nr:DUF2332 domain-containing protein [Jatrophihabitans sp.]